MRSFLISAVLALFTGAAFQIVIGRVVKNSPIIFDFSVGDIGEIDTVLRIAAIVSVTAFLGVLARGHHAERRDTS